MWKAEPEGAHIINMYLHASTYNFIISSRARHITLTLSSNHTLCIIYIQYMRLYVYIINITLYFIYDIRILPQMYVRTRTVHATLYSHTHTYIYTAAAIVTNNINAHT